MESKLDYKPSIIYLIAFNCSLGSVAWGYKLTVFNALRVFLQTNVFPDASDHTIAVIASSLTLGAAIGAFLTGKFVSTYGRMKTLMFADALGILGSALCMIHSLPMIFLGRTISGFSIGINSAAISLYNVEMAPLKLKGQSSTISMAMLAFGVMLGFVSEHFVPDLIEGKDSQVWKILLGFGMTFHIARSAILLRALHFETPFYLVSQNRMEEAKDVLAHIYTDNIDGHLEKVIKDRNAAITANGHITVSDLFTPKYKKATLVSILLVSGVQLCGFCPIIMFLNMFIKESAGGDPHTMKSFSNLWGFVSFIFTIFAAFIIEKCGRRPLIVIFTGCLGAVELLYVFISMMNGQSDPSLKYLLTIFWPIFYRLSAGTLAFGYCSEVLPSVGVSFAIAVNWVLAFLVVQTFIPLEKIIGLEGIMFLWSAFLIASTVIFKKHLLESKGKTKAELLSLYNGDVNDGEAILNQVEMNKMPLLFKAKNLI